jgi:hypothetical protein
MTFRVGMKVVCINAGVIGDPIADKAEWEASERIFEGRIYTIARVLIDYKGVCILHLFEVRRSLNSRLDHGSDVGYYAGRFRPIVEPKTDIGFAHEILRKVTKRRKVDA